MSNKREIFVKLSNSRLKSALKSIRLIGNLGNKSHYEYNENDKRIIEDALREALKDAMSRFRVEKKKNEFLIK